MVTPPIEAVRHRDRCELRWEPASPPLRYDAAPLLIDGRGYSDCPKLRKVIGSAERSTGPAQFSSCFRSRRTPLPRDVGRELCRVFDRIRHDGESDCFATRYEQTMPHPPSMVDRVRRRTYLSLLKEANNGKGSDGRGGGGGPPRRRKC